MGREREQGGVGDVGRHVSGRKGQLLGAVAHQYPKPHHHYSDVPLCPIVFTWTYTSQRAGADPNRSMQQLCGVIGK